MKVRFKQGIASREYSYSAGKEIDVPKKQADMFIKAGIAEKVETATKPKPKENTSVRKGRKKDADND